MLALDLALAQGAMVPPIFERERFLLANARCQGSSGQQECPLGAHALERAIEEELTLVLLSAPNWFFFPSPATLKHFLEAMPEK